MQLPKLSDCVFVDTETNGTLNPVMPGLKVRGIGYYAAPLGDTQYLDMDEWDGDLDKLAQLQELLRDRYVVAHNLHYDLLVLMRLGLELPPWNRWLCTLTLARVAAPGLPKFGLKDMGASMFGEDDTAEDQAMRAWCKANKVKVSDRFARAPQELLEVYCKKDVELCAKVWVRLKAHLEKPAVEREFLEEMEVLDPIVRAEFHGMRTDQKELASVERKLLELKAGYTRSIINLTGGVEFNIGSTKQLAARLFGEGLPGRYTKKGAKSTSKESLLAVQSRLPAAEAVLKLREVEKLQGYCKDYRKYDRGGRVSCVFQSLGAKTGRMSSRNPNLQNIPRPSEKGAALIRRMFIPEKGHRIVAADFSQIELRIGALYAGDRNMLALLAAGGDIHKNTAKLVFQESNDFLRQCAKTLNFLMFYGGTADKLMESLFKVGHGVSLKQAREIVVAYKKAFPGISGLFSRVREDVQLNGGVTDLLGRFYPVPRHQSYKGVNYLVQGTCARILKGAIRRLPEMLANYDATMISFIHDEILVSAPIQHCELIEREESGKKVYGAYRYGLLDQIRDAMEVPISTAITVDTPAELAVCEKNWAEKKKVSEWL